MYSLLWKWQLRSDKAAINPNCHLKYELFQTLRGFGDRLANLFFIVVYF